MENQTLFNPTEQTATMQQHNTLYPFFNDSQNRHAAWYRRAFILLKLMCIGLSIYFCFTPFALIGEVSIGSAVELALELFKNEKESSQYLHLAFPITALITVFLSLLEFFTIPEHFMIQSTPKKQPSWGALIGHIVPCGVLLVLSHLLLSGLCDYYGLKLITPYFVIILFFVPDFVLYLASSISVTLKKQKNAGELEEKCPPQREPKKNKARAILLAVALALTLFLACFPVYGLLEAPTSMIKPYTNCEIDSWFEGELLTVGELITRSINVSQEKGLHIDITDDSTVWKENSANNYLYYEAKIQELYEEKNALKPKEVSTSDEKAISESLKEYLEEYAKLETEINYLRDAQETLSCQYAIIEFGPLQTEKGTTGSWPFVQTTISYKKEILSYTHNRNQNYHDAGGKKWGYSDGSLSSKILGESITLSKSSFDVGTDFSQEKIVATVRYSDGSKKISFITPKNLEDLNNAESGIKVIKWSDEWGDYEAEISITD